jgi:hypothetical protein
MKIMAKSNSALVRGKITIILIRICGYDPAYYLILSLTARTKYPLFYEPRWPSVGDSNNIRVYVVNWPIALGGSHAENCLLYGLVAR